MGVLALTLAFKYSRSNQSARAVLLALADSADDNGVCFPGTALLAKKSGTSDASVKRAIKKLVELGEIQIVKKGGMFGDIYVSNTYKILLHKLTEDYYMQGVQNDPGVTVNPEGGHGDTVSVI